MIDANARDYEQLRELMLALGRQRIDGWTDQQPGDMGVLLVELMAWMGDQLFYHQDRIANESFLATAVEPRSVADLLALIGQRLRPPQPASVRLLLDFELAEGAAPVVIESGAAFEVRTADGSTLGFRYLGAPREIPRSGSLSVDVLQVDAVVVDERAGSGDGGAWQRFALRRAPIQEETLDLRVDNITWHQVSNLLDSGPGDRHFVLLRDAEGGASVQFGDGVTGAVPSRGHDNIVASYRAGGGARGNVTAGSAWKAIRGVPRELASISQPHDASGGAETESLRAAARRGPLQLRSMGRAVTASDFEAHALANGALRARVVPRGWNRVEVVVVPPGGGPPTDLFLDQIRAKLATIAMVGVEVVVRGPVLVPVELVVELTLDPYAVRSMVAASARSALTALYSADRLDFAAPLYLSKVYEALEALPGVAAVWVRRFCRDASKPLGDGGRLVFSGAEVPAVSVTEPTLLGGRHA